MRPADRLRAWVPAWWQGGGGVAGEVLRVLLMPAEAAFRSGARIRERLFDAGVFREHRASVPVISVGNITVGGTGKTPISATIAGTLLQWGHRPAIVLRGYGADEVEVHRELNPGIRVEAAPRRMDAVEVAAAAGCDCVVLDDGFQHRHLARDLDVVVVSAERWAPPRRLLPRGPWREPPEALLRADYLVVSRKSGSAELARSVVADIRGLGFTGPVGVAYLAPTSLARLNDRATGTGAGESHFTVTRQSLAELRDRDVLVVSSLGDPTLFLDQVRGAGARAELLAYPDHHDFSDADTATIMARASGRPIVITRKEAVKLRGRPLNMEVLVVHQTVTMEQGEDELHQALNRAIGGKG